MAPAIPDHGTILQPLYTAVGDKSGSTPIDWSDELISAFKNAQQSLDTAQPLTQPKSGEQLYMTTDASQKGIAATLHRESDKAIVKYFSSSLSTDKQRWLPCELEALAIGTGLQTLAPYFRESEKKAVVYTDSQPCVLAYKKMQRNAFSASPRISTFLREVVNHGAELR